MSYNILSIVPGHNSSACLLSDGEIIYFLEEERLSRFKKDGNPFRVINDILNRYKVDEIILAGVNVQSPSLLVTGEDLYHGMVRKYNPNVKFSWVGDQHHLTHSFSSFYNSGFSKAISVVVDGNGSRFKHKVNNKSFESDEIESIYIHQYPSQHNLYNSTQLCYKLKNNFNKNNYNFINTIGIGHAYEAISTYLGFGFLEAGKTMGLSSYGKMNKNISTILSQNFRNKTLFFYEPNPDFQFLKVKDSSFSSLPSEDIAYKIQQESQKLVGDYIEKAIKETGLKQVCCSGGYFLNCVANYYLKKRFSDIEFYFEPIANDAGTAIGAAQWVWYQKTQSKLKKPQKTLYYGPQYSKEEVLKGIKKYL